MPHASTSTSPNKEQKQNETEKKIISSSTCRYCERTMTFQTDLVSLRPCGCAVCKDCWIQHISEAAAAIFTSPSSLSSCVECRLCKSAVESHCYQKQHVLNNGESALQTNEVDFKYPEQQEKQQQQAAQAFPPLKVSNLLADGALAIASDALAKASAALKSAADATTAASPKKAAANTDSTPPGKKNRGRPRKLPLNKNKAADETTKTAEAPSETPSPAKKKRGRPPKTSQLPTTLEETTQSKNNPPDEATKTPEATSQTPPPAKKKRGRPPANRPPPDETKKKRYTPRKTFDERLHDFLEYKNKFGHTRVPYRSQGYESLGEWVKDVRRGQVKLTRNQREILNKAGFIWETKRNMQERLWYETLDKLKKYKEQYGDCRVRHAEDKVLYEWINTQRKAKNKNELKKDREEALEAIGITWSKPLSTATTPTKVEAEETNIDVESSDKENPDSNLGDMNDPSTNTEDVPNNEFHPDSAGDDRKDDHFSDSIYHNSVSNIHQSNANNMIDHGNLASIYPYHYHRPF